MVKVHLPRGKKGSKVKFQDTLFKYTGRKTLKIFLCWWIELYELIFSKINLYFTNKLQKVNQCSSRTAQDTRWQVLDNVTSENTGLDYPTFKWENKLIHYHLRRSATSITPISREAKMNCVYNLGMRYTNASKNTSCISNLRCIPPWRKVKHLRVVDEQTEKEYQGSIFNEIHYRLIKHFFRWQR